MISTRGEDCDQHIPHIALHWQKKRCRNCQKEIWCDLESEFCSVLRAHVPNASFDWFCRRCSEVSELPNVLFEAFTRQLARVPSKIALLSWPEMLALAPDLLSLRNHDGRTLAHLAFEYANPELLKLVLERCPDLLHALDMWNETPLHRPPLSFDRKSKDKEVMPVQSIAPHINGLTWPQIYDRAVDCAQILLDAKANVNAQVGTDCTWVLNSCAGSRRLAANSSCGEVV